MDIKNESLARMLDSAIKIKKQNEAKQKEEDKSLVESLPKIQDSYDVAEPSSVSLSLDPDKPLTLLDIKNNVSIDQTIKGSSETIQKAKRKAARYTTGASAAVPLVCKGESCPFKARCVAEDTLVFTSKGDIKIQDIIIGDIVYSINNDTHLLEKDLVLDVVCSGTKEVYKIITKYGLELEVTSDHPILTYDYESDESYYSSLESNIEKGSAIFTADPNMILDINTLGLGDLFFDTVVDIQFEGEKEVYDIEVQNNHNFLANSICVHNCPYFAENLHEVGEDCILEKQLSEFWTHKYVNELQIDPNSISEVHMIGRLVELDVMDLRMSNYMAINDQDLMMDFITSADATGGLVSNKGVSVAFDVKERIQKQRMKLLESLNNTREKKIKTSIEEEKSSRTASQKSLFDRLDRMFGSNKVSSDNIIDAEVITVSDRE